MKNILLTLLLFIFLSSDIFSQELTPLSDYMQTADQSSPSTAEYVCIRCGSISLALAKFQGPDRKEHNKNLFDFWYISAVTTRQLSRPNDDYELIGLDILEKMELTAMVLSNIMEESEEETKNIFKNNFIRNDLDICNSMPLNVRDILEP